VSDRGEGGGFGAFLFGVVLGAFAHHTKYGIKQAEGSDADTNLPPR